MTTRFAPSFTEISQYDNLIEISPNVISQKMKVLEVNLLDIQLTDQLPSEKQLYLIDAKKMLNFARDNLKKGFYHVSDASLLLAKKYLERCKLE